MQPIFYHSNFHSEDTFPILIVMIFGLLTGSQKQETIIYPKVATENYNLLCLFTQVLPLAVRMKRNNCQLARNIVRAQKAGS